MLLNALGVNYFKQAEIRTAERVVPKPSVFDLEMTVLKLKSHKSPAIDQIPAEFIKAEGRKILSEIYKFINFIWNKEEFPEE